MVENVKPNRRHMRLERFENGGRAILLKSKMSSQTKEGGQYSFQEGGREWGGGKGHARSDIRIARTKRPALPMTFQSLSCQQNNNGLIDLKGLKGYQRLSQRTISILQTTGWLACNAKFPFPKQKNVLHKKPSKYVDKIKLHSKMNLFRYTSVY